MFFFVLFCFVFVPKRNATYVWTSLPYPIEFFYPYPRVCTDGRSTPGRSTTGLKKKLTAGDDLAWCQVYWRRQVLPGEILLWKSKIRCYDQLCFGLCFGLFFGSIGFNFLLRMGLHSARFAGADAVLKRSKSGKYIRNIFVNSKIRKNRSFSVWSPILKVIFTTFLTAFYSFTHDKWIKDWSFP